MKAVICTKNCMDRTYAVLFILLIFIYLFIYLLYYYIYVIYVTFILYLLYLYLLLYLYYIYNIIILFIQFYSLCCIFYETVAIESFLAQFQIEEFYYWWLSVSRGVAQF